MSLLGVMFRLGGRINRRTYWLKGILPLYVGWISCIGVVMYYIADCWHLFRSDNCEVLGNEIMALLFILAFAWIFASFWMLPAVCFKRLHDLGKSGWWSLTLLLPISILILGILEGQPSSNRYGPPPTDEAPVR